MIYWGITARQWAYIPAGFLLVALEAFVCRYLVQVNVDSCITACCELQAAAIQQFRPDVLVASSFGGGIAVHLLSKNIWKGPTLLLAPAQYVSWPRSRHLQL